MRYSVTGHSAARIGSEVILVHLVTSQHARIAACLAIATVVASVAAADSVKPGIKDVLTVPVASGAVIAPDGSAVAYTLRTSDWSDNRFDAEIQIVDSTGESRALTNAQGDSSSRPKWSPDSRWLAYTTGGSQVHLIPAEGGESIQLTALMGGVMDFAWSPDGKTMGIIIPDPPAHMMRQAQWGKFTIEEVDTFHPRLWLLDVEAARTTQGGIRRGSAALRPLTGDHDFVVRSFIGANFAFSPGGGEIVFTHVPDSHMASMLHPDISVVDLDSGEIRPLVAGPGFQGGAVYSSDGDWVIFYAWDTASKPDGPSPLTSNYELARVPAKGGEPEVLTEDWDEHVTLIDYTEQGVRFVGNVRTTQHIYRLDPETREIEAVVTTPNAIDASVSAMPDGGALAYVGHDGATVNEVYRVAASDYEPVRLTGITDAWLTDWPRHATETVRWESFDGVEVEGVLYKPASFDPNKRHPLIVQIHGGPVVADKPRRLNNWEYPIEQWLDKGALILQPNYRGSNGYGERFRSLTYRAGGLPLAKDVDAGVDYLVSKGIADPERVGVCGWSHGGYVSAFLLGTSDKYKAISIGAGPTHSVVGFATSNTYVAAKPGHGAWPWEDPDLYHHMSPIHLMRNARTPTLIQHGRNDARVPFAEASLLFRTLKHMGNVEVRMYVFDEAGHMLGRPRERLAAQWQNYHWFSRYLWGEEAKPPWE